MTTIDLFPLVGDFAEDKNMAAEIRDTKIRPALAKGEKVVMNFTSITLVTQSFVHALISDILRTTGEEALEKLEFHGCAAGVKGIIETVVQYSLETMDESNGSPSTSAKNA